MTLPDQAEDYARRLDAGLKRLPTEERERIVLEIRGHLAERAAAGALDASLSALGRPELLARTFVEDHQMTTALAQTNPTALLVTVLDRATRSVAAAVIGFGALSLYLLSIGFALVAVLKPLFPEHVGFWLDPLKFGAFVGETLPAGPELLGWKIVPVAAGLAIACWFLAGPVLRRGAQRFLTRPVFRVG
jgi:uncharacterized membrane protein